ncbi:DUF5677 domain-containing protein [Amycolatopsis sp. VS8301801F10]|uniref:DUF5677 domain-containing protein n=1 Tax=Amycolatopsis sp. VS8301801F10 TaxID=2652442 RepID=UPI0038FC0DDC
MNDSVDNPPVQRSETGNMPESDEQAGSLKDRIEAVEGFIKIVERLAEMGDLKWADVESDYRLLAVNVALRRQIESLRAAVALARQNLGHLAVSFVRASLEDVIYLGFFVPLALEDSQKLFLLLGNWDSTRSLLAQRAYVGDEVMKKLWYPKSFLDAVQHKRDDLRTQLKVLQKYYKWSGGALPSAAWIAEKAGRKDLYDYLHAATSRSLHFSAGEIMRRGWGHPSGKMITDEPEFRAHLSSFALDQLWRLYAETWMVAAPLMEAAAITIGDDLQTAEMEAALNRLVALGKVPLVHAHEWNLTPEGHVRLQ